MTKNFWIAIIIIIIIALIGWGIWSYYAIDNAPQQTTTTSTAATIPTSSPTTSASSSPATTTSNTTSSSMSPIAGPGDHCGGNMRNAPTCEQGYQCEPETGSHLPFGDVGGTCVAVQPAQ